MVEQGQPTSAYPMSVVCPAYRASSVLFQFLSLSGSRVTSRGNRRAKKVFPPAPYFLSAGLYATYRRARLLKGDQSQQERNETSAGGV